MKHNALILFLLLATLSVIGKGCTNSTGWSDSRLRAEFADPGNEWRAKPFWAWNGELKEEELLRQADILRQMGFGGYFMHARIGLHTEYLGDEWFRLVNRVADYGDSLGMENYLYDEDRWPSGTAGGYVTMDPEFRMNYMSMYRCPAEKFVWNDSIEAAFSCRLDGIRFTELERIVSGGDMLRHTGKEIIWFVREKAADDDFVNGFSYVDAMNRAATEKFIEATHTRYKTECGGRMGRSISGFFTDEPHRGPLFSSFSNRNANRPYMVPWTDKLPEEYAKRFGGDILEKLPFLFLQSGDEALDRVKWEYCDLTQQLFLENFLEPIYDWCESNGMVLTGHLLHEDSFTAQVVMQGSLMRAYAYMHIPGVDVLTQGNRNYWIVKQLASIARQKGRKRLLSELYGCTGWQMTFADYKSAGDWQALYGINVRCPHLSWYTMKGEAKRDYPASIFFQSGWYRDYKYVEDYYARLGLMLSQGKPDCHLLVISPIESVMARVKVESFQGLKSRDNVIRKMEHDYARLFQWLQEVRIDFDYGDEAIMASMCRVEKNAGRTQLCIGESCYETVLIQNMETIRNSTLDILCEFARKGGQVILCGDAPRYVDVFPSERAATFLEERICVPMTRDAVVEAVQRTVPSPVIVKDGTSGQELTNIFCQSRYDGERMIYVLLNMSPQIGYSNAEIYLPVLGEVTEWNCRTGEVSLLRSQGSCGNTIVRADFAPMQEKVFVVSKNDFSAKAQPEFTERTLDPLPDRFNYSLREKNVLPLDFARFRINGNPPGSPTEILKIDRSVRRHFGLKYRGGEMLQPWFVEKFRKSGQDCVYGTVELSFSFCIEILPVDSLFLCIESPNDFTIRINGNRIDTSVDAGWWVDPCIRRFAIDPNWLKQGENVITTVCDFRESTDLETLYLIGDFGVQLNGNTGVLTGVPEQLRIGSLVEQGFPFYSGSVSYRMPAIAVPSDRERILLEFPGFDGACIAVNSPDKRRIVAFPPYRADITDAVRAGEPIDVEVMLTRRNTFGPLHLNPPHTTAYGPETFLTEGARFTPEYLLLPSGLTAKPFIILQQAK